MKKLLIAVLVLTVVITALFTGCSQKSSPVFNN
jgi:uncharacterized membrane protein YciS (DUF1049 family)